MAASLFTRILQGEIPAHFVYRDEATAVILDKFPTVAGQMLVIPVREVDYLFDLDHDTYQRVCALAKRAAMAADRVFTPARTCLVVEGFEVPHVHIKLYPMPTGDTDLGAKLRGGDAADDETLASHARALAAAFPD